MRSTKIATGPHETLLPIGDFSLSAVLSSERRGFPLSYCQAPKAPGEQGRMIARHHAQVLRNFEIPVLSCDLLIMPIIGLGYRY
jgi:hypothetical protein